MTDVLPMRLEAASGSSEAPDTAEAGRAAASEAMAGLRGATPALIIVYASVRYHLPTLLTAVRAVTGDAPLVGETSAGHFRGVTLTNPASGVAVLALTGGPYRFAVASSGGLSSGGLSSGGLSSGGLSSGGLSSGAERVGAELARATRSAFGDTRSRYAALLVFADGLAAEQEALVAGLHGVTGSAVPVVGGAAGDDRQLTETFVFHDDRALTDAAVAVWIDSDHPLPVTVGHGWHAIGLPMLVTKVDGQVVHEIAGRPARDVFEQYIQRGDPNPGDHTRSDGYYSTHAFGMIDPNGSHLIRAVMVGTDGLIRTFAPLPVYSAIQIMSCDEDDLLAMSDQVAQRSIAGRDASVLLVFSCVARLDILRARGAEEPSRLQAAAGRVPVFGVYTYGEFARTSSVAGYHNATVAAVAL